MVWRWRVLRNGCGVSVLVNVGWRKPLNVPCRLCRLKSHTRYDHRPRIQNLLHVWNREHCRNGSLRSVCTLSLRNCLYPGAYLFLVSLIPETKGRSLEDMDIIFGSVSAEQRQKNIEERENGSLLL